MNRLMIVFGGMLCTASMSWGNLMVYDGFDYDATGNPVLGIAATGAKAKGVWTSQGNGTNEVRITSGSLSYPGMGDSIGNSAVLDNNGGNTGQGADASRLYTGGTNTTGTFYYSFIASIPAYTSNPAGFTEAYLAGFDNTSASTYGKAGALYIRQDSTDVGKFDLGVNTSDGTGLTYSSTAYSPGTVFVVVGFTFGGPATLDVYANGDAVPVTAPVTHDAVTSTSDSTLTSITNVFLRGNPGEPQGIGIDELRVGTGWADVASPLPEPASLSLLAIGAVAGLRRRRTLM